MNRFDIEIECKGYAFPYELPENTKRFRIKSISLEMLSKLMFYIKNNVSCTLYMEDEWLIEGSHQFKILPIQYDRIEYPKIQVSGQQAIAICSKYGMYIPPCQTDYYLDCKLL